MRYVEEVFGFSGQVAIICSIVAAVICLIVFPQDMRQKIFFYICVPRRTIKFTVKSRLDNNEFIIEGHKRNEKIISRYFEGKYDKLYLKIADHRKYAIMKSIIFNKDMRQQKILKPVLNKIRNQHLECDRAIECLLLDKSAINAEVYRKKYVYSDLIKSIIKYCIQDSTDQTDGIKISFFYLKTKQNKLPHDIELKINIDRKFLERYSKKIAELYFSERGNMDIYDLETGDYIKYIAPRFYSFISVIRDGEWVYSNLDIKQYQIDHFEFDLYALYKICKEERLV